LSIIIIWTQKKVSIKCLRSDRGAEYRSAAFDAQQGTIRRLTVHDTPGPEYNGVSERLNRTLLNKVRTMLHDSGLPLTWSKIRIKHRTHFEAWGKFE
jgi:hypothetical protein